MPRCAASARRQRPTSSSSSRAGTATTARSAVTVRPPGAVAPPRRRRRRPGRARRRLSAVAQVVHDEVAVGLGLHARLVEAAAPRGVLERVVADGGPEARSGRPLGVLAGQRAAGDLAVRQRVAPVLDAQAPPGAGVLGGGDVADGEHSRVRAAHRGVDAAPLRLDDRGPRRRPARSAGRRRCPGPRGRRAAPRRPSATRASAARCARPQRRGGPRRRPRTAASVMSSPARSPRRCGLRSLLGRDEDHVEAAAHERRRRLAGDEAGADDHRTGARRRRGAQPQGVVDRADRVQARVLGARRSAGAGAPSRWRARRRRRPAPGRPRGARRAAWRSSATARRARRRDTAWAANQCSALEREVGGRRARRAGAPWSAAGAGRAGAARRR